MSFMLLSSVASESVIICRVFPALQLGMFEELQYHVSISNFVIAKKGVGIYLPILKPPSEDIMFSRVIVLLVNAERLLMR